MTTITSTAMAATPIAPRASATGRAADGDFLTKGAGHDVKDADGDFKPTVVAASFAVSPAAKATPSVQAALATLAKGG